MAAGAATPSRIARWLGRYCVYRFPGCTCRLSPTYMAFYRSLLAAERQAGPPAGQAPIQEGKMAVHRRLLALEVEHDDVGLTLNTTIRLGSEIIAEYHAGTRYPDTADSVAEELLAKALRPLLQQVIADEGVRPAIRRSEI